MALDHISSVVGLGSIEPNGPSIGMITHFLAGMLQICIAYCEVKIVGFRLLQQVSNEDGCRTASADDQDIMHRAKVLQWEQMYGTNLHYRDNALKKASCFS
jgi:hypothetical protein